MTALTLSISNISVRQDNESRFCLNDLHKASGGDIKHQPSNWLRNQQAIDLVDYLKSEESSNKKHPTSVKQGVGTFVVKELVYAYAMWISARFHITVIRAYDSLVTASPRNALVVLPKLTPSHQCHIQGVVKKLVNTQVGSTYSIVWGSVKKHFDVGTYKDIPEIKYPELCGFLKCEPLPAKSFPENTEFGQRFITRVCGNETETMPVPDGAFVLTAEQIKNNLQEVLPGYRLVDKETYAIFAVLKNQIIEQSHNKGTPA